jgi:hypothetical protein
MLKSSRITAGMNDKENESPKIVYRKIEPHDIIKIEPHDIITKYYGYSPNTHTFMYLNRRELDEYARRYIENELKQEKERERVKERKREKERKRKKEKKKQAEEKNNDDNQNDNQNLEDFRWLMEGLNCMNSKKS